MQNPPRIPRVPVFEMSRGEIFGVMLADIVIEAANITYNAERGRKIINACIKRLNERKNEIVGKEATPEYKKARYK